MSALPFRLLVLAAAIAAAPKFGYAQAGGAKPAVTDADIHFMQGMISHHAQAVVMSHLVTSRTTSTPVRLLAERIDVAQQQEITQMQRWLEAHGAAVPAADGSMPGHEGMAGHSMLMPGMLSAEQLAQLAAVSGAAFDERFLTFMIQHHEGALAMVATLFSTQGSGHEPAIFEFASDVDAGQRAEINRMRALLKQRAR
jgi:uncharacterized protein (DUF305 family)